jgi:HEAT repeat protein
MLEDLDKIDWNRFPAGDVPQLLRTLLSPDEEQRYAAVNELFDDICHQGTIYEASIYAIPFLIELLQSSATPDRSTVAVLLASIASGNGFFEVHAEINPGPITWREILAREGRDLDKELEREREITTAVRREAAKGLPLLIPFLSDPEPDVRSAVARALGAFPEHHDAHLEILTQALKTETDEDVRGEIEESIGRLRST